MTDRRSQGQTYGAKDRQSQRWEGIGDAQSHGWTEVVTGGSDGVVETKSGQAKEWLS